MIIFCVTIGMLVFGWWLTRSNHRDPQFFKQVMLLALGWSGFLVVFSSAMLFREIESSAGPTGFFDALAALRYTLGYHFISLLLIGFILAWQRSALRRRHRF